MINSASLPQPVNFRAHQITSQTAGHEPSDFQQQSSRELMNSETTMQTTNGFYGKDDMEDFWYDLLAKAGNSSEVFGNFG